MGKLHNKILRMAMQIPILFVQARTLPQAWEKAVLKTWNKGLRIRTEYDKPNDPPSRDCTMVIVVTDPMKEPRIHRAFPAGLEDLEIYRQEVVEGIHDHWIKPEEGKWTYTYHKRLFAFESDGKTVDQINYIIKKLSNTHYSRRAQAVTWAPSTDPFTDDPPCLQRLWCRVNEDAGGGLILNMNSHWRSRDAYKAAFMNMFALVDLQKMIAEKIAQAAKRPVGIGRYVDISDSFHIYGSYYAEFQNFLNLVAKRSFRGRTWTAEFAEPYFNEARKKIEAEKCLRI